MKKFFISKWKILLSEFTSVPLKKQLKNMSLMILGAFLLALGTEMFLVPMKVVAGGSSSLALIFAYFIPAISVEVFITITYWFCFLVGLFTLGIKYSFKTLIVTIASPLFVFLIHFLIENVYVNGYYIFDLRYWAEKGFYLISETKLDSNASSVICLLIAVIIGPIVEGIGIAITMACGGSSGGTDVFSILINKNFKIKIGLSGFLVDSLIIFVGFISVNNFNFPHSLLGIIASAIIFITIDKVFYAFNSTYIAFISSDKYEEITDFIINKIGRTATLIKSKGAYSKKDTYLIETCFSKYEYFDIQKEILRIDPYAFIRVMKSQEILGFGFTKDVKEDLRYSSNKEEEKKE